MEEKTNLIEYTFEDLVRNQFEYGGKKYALQGNNERESTDDLFDDFGKNWLFGTLGKYIKRYRNLSRERDLLKIACYTYLLWLKRGFFIDYKRVIPIDTNLELKQKYYVEFIEKYNKFYINYKETSKKILTNLPYTDNDYLIVVYGLLKELAEKEWNKVKEYNLFSIFHIMKIIWERNYNKETSHDTDTENETRTRT